MLYMKAFFLSDNQALTDRINKMRDDHGVRGFTRWALSAVRGADTGGPHYGTHAWPSLSTSVLAVVEADQVRPLLTAVRGIDSTTGRQGSRAFV